MRVKFSEKKLFAGIVCFSAGIFILFKIQFIKTPVRLAEPGILFFLLAFGLIAIGVFLFKRSALKV